VTNQIYAKAHSFIFHTGNLSNNTKKKIPGTEANTASQQYLWTVKPPKAIYKIFRYHKNTGVEIAVIP
jgi:hypothetical protein